MKLIKPSFEILESQGYLKDIEIAGRTCYKSEDKITSDSAEEFVERMIESGHYAMLEHGTIYLKIFAKSKKDYIIIDHYVNNKYSKYTIDVNNYCFITTNCRVLVENGWLDDLQYVCKPDILHKKRTSVRFICDIGISREFNRHRVNSMGEQSTRCCNYTKDKFGNELSIIQPEEIFDIEIDNCKNTWCSKKPKTNREDNDIFRNMCNNIYLEEDNSTFNIIDTWLFANLACQWSYNRLIQLGWKPQQARRVLPLDLQTELVHTAFDNDWKHFFDLRDNFHAHPQALELAHPLHEEFIKLGKCK